MKKIISLVLILIILMGMATISNATITEKTANINVAVNKQDVTIEDEVVVTVSWKDKMEAVEFLLGYDKDKLEYVSSSMDTDYIKVKDGKVEVVWISLNGKGINSITFTFKAKTKGNATFTISEALLADENVESPDSYKYNTKTLNIKEKEVKPEETTKPETPNKNDTTTQTPNNDKQTATETKKDTPTVQTTKKPKRYTQAGTNVTNYVIGAVVLTIIATFATVVIKLRRK